MISPFNGLAHLEIHWQGHLLAYLQGGLHIGDIYPCALLPTERLVRALLFESLLMTMNNELPTRSGSYPGLKTHSHSPHNILN